MDINIIPLTSFLRLKQLNFHLQSVVPHRQQQQQMNIALGLIMTGLIGKRFLAYVKRRDFQYTVGSTSSVVIQPYKGGFHSQMTRKQAFLILGLEESALPDAVKDKHRKLMMLNHPDNAGSTFLATKINEAKDFLIG